MWELELTLNQPVRFYLPKTWIKATDFLDFFLLTNFITHKKNSLSKHITLSAIHSNSFIFHPLSWRKSKKGWFYRKVKEKKNNQKFNSANCQISFSWFGSYTFYFIFDLLFYPKDIQHLQNNIDIFLFIFLPNLHYNFVGFPNTLIHIVLKIIFD